MFKGNRKVTQAQVDTKTLSSINLGGKRERKREYT